jgi:hypothetical protein
MNLQEYYKNYLKTRLLESKPMVYARVNAYHASSSGETSRIRNAHERGLITAATRALRRKLRSR